MLVAEQVVDNSLDVDLTFMKDDLRDVIPHDNDLVVISVVTAGRKVHRVMVDQGSSADVMFSGLHLISCSCLLINLGHTRDVCMVSQGIKWRCVVIWS